MPATDPQSLLAAANCLACYGTSPAQLQLMKLGLLSSLAAQLNPTGVLVSTIAGQVGVTGSADGPALSATFNGPGGVATFGGNVYVADEVNATLRRIAGGVVTTLAGLAGTPGGSDGTGSAARFGGLRSMVCDPVGNIFAVDYDGDTIRMITPAGVVTTLAGLYSTPGSTDGTGAAARFSGPAGICIDVSGNVFVSDQNNHTIRKISPAGVVTTFAGLAGLYGNVDGIGPAARLNAPAGMTMDGAGNIYVVDYTTCTVRKITPGADVTTVAGTAYAIGSVDGTGIAARFSGPYGICFGADGNAYICEFNSSLARKMTPGLVVTTIAGAPNVTGSSDGTGLMARFNNPIAIASDGAATLYVADYSNDTIRKLEILGTDPASLLAQAKCAECYGSSPALLQLMKLGLLKQAIESLTS